MPAQFIENRTYDEIQVGDSATLTRTLRPEDIQLFAIMSGDVNPAHVDPEYAHSSMFHEVIAHGMWGGALISTVLGTEFPGPGTIYIGQTLRFSRPVKVGDTITVKVTCKQKFDHNKHMIFECLCTNQDGLKVIVDPTADREQVAEAVISLPISGKAGLLDTIEYFFRAGDTLIRKRVDFYLMNYAGGTLTPQLSEVDAVEWVPLSEAIQRASFDSERKLLEMAQQEIDSMRASLRV